VLFTVLVVVAFAIVAVLALFYPLAWLAMLALIPRRAPS
jgi:1,4-dihydroxy-2-naphthoate octaprenyltransferase